MLTGVGLGDIDQVVFDAFGAVVVSFRANDEPVVAYDRGHDDTQRLVGFDVVTTDPTDAIEIAHEAAGIGMPLAAPKLRL